MESIKEKLNNIDLNNSAETIEFYNENRSYFDNYDEITDEEAIEDLVFIKLKYCDAIEKKNFYSEAADILEHIHILLDSIKEKSTKYNRYFESALFYEAAILGRQKKYSESNNKIAKLIIIDPENENYKEWFDSNKVNIIDKRLNITSLVIMPMIVFVIFTKSKILGKSYLIIEILLFTVLISVTLFQYYYSTIIKKRQK